MDFSKKNLDKGLLNRELGDSNLGQVTQFDFCEFRERDWSNVLTCQTIAPAPYLWSSSNHSISKIPVESTFPKTRATAVCVSQCGNFGVIGYENGQIQKFLMQSGKDKGSFFAPSGNL